MKIPIILLQFFTISALDINYSNNITTNYTRGKQCVDILLTSSFNYNTVCNFCIKQLLNNGYYNTGSICIFELDSIINESYTCCLV